MSETIAVVRSYEDLVEAFRAIKERLGLTNAACDRLANLGEGATDKVLGPTGAKNIGPLTLNAFCWLFAVKFEMRIDLDQVKLMEQYWENSEAPRWFPGEKMNRRVSKAVLDRAKPLVLKESGRAGGLKSASLLSAQQARRKGGKSRAKKLTKAQRKEIARKAGIASAAKRKARCVAEPA